MKVFLAGASFRPEYGGPAYSISRLATAMAEIGVDVSLWAPDGSAENAPVASERSSVQLLDGRLGAALSRVGKPDILHDNGIWLPHNCQLAKFASTHHIPRVVSTRGMLEPWALRHKTWKKRLAWLLYQRRGLNSAQALHATAKPEADHLRAFAAGLPIWTIPNGMDLPLARLPDNTVIDRHSIALFLGRLYPVKGLPMLIEAWARLRPPNWQLVIAGPDEAGHRRELERAVTTSNLGDIVIFAGPLYGTEKSAAFAKADLFVLPSHSESFGMAIAEALSYSVPVLTTTATPWPSLESRGCGWRVEPTVEGIEAGLRHATLNTREDLRRMGALGRTLISEEFAWSRVANDFISQYSELLRTQRATA